MVTPLGPPPAATVALPQRLRLFFALWPDERVRAKLAAYARAAHERTGGRVMRPDGLHITLAFLGDSDASRLDALRAAVGGVAVHAFDWTLDEAAFWKHNRIVWVGASAVPKPLGALVADLRGALQAAGFPFDAKPFVPHVTLVRKGAPPRELPPLVPISWRVERFALVRSVLNEEGSRYEVIGAWPATGRP